MKYEEYENLVVDCAYYSREANQILQRYIHEYGDLITKLFEVKLDCITNKKAISFCQTFKNRGTRIDYNQLNSYLDEEMKGYHEQLKVIKADCEAAKEIEYVSEHDAEKVKAIYRKIARKIHPDINSNLYINTDDAEVFLDLWVKVKDAYNNNSIVGISALEIQVNKELKKREIEVENIVIEDMEFKAEQLKKEIDNILNTNPYQYKFLLNDEEACAERKASLNREIEEYTKYNNDLKNTLMTLIGQGVDIKLEMNS